MTGFRVAKGGAQEILGVNADLSTFGKIIGGGLPVGAFGGKKEIMEMVAPSGTCLPGRNLKWKSIGNVRRVCGIKLISKIIQIFMIYLKKNQLIWKKELKKT